MNHYSYRLTGAVIITATVLIARVACNGRKRETVTFVYFSLKIWDATTISTLPPIPGDQINPLTRPADITEANKMGGIGTSTVDAVVKASLFAQIASVARVASFTRAIKTVSRVSTHGVRVTIVETEATFLHVRAFGVRPGSQLTNQAQSRSVREFGSDESRTVERRTCAYEVEG